MEAVDDVKTDAEEECISANVAENGARKIAEDEYGLVAGKIKRIAGYDDLNFYLMPPVTAKNGVGASQLWPHGYMLKVINSRDSQNEEFFCEYVNVLLHLNKENFPCPCPMTNKEGQYIVYWIDWGHNREPRKHIVLLLTFLQGEVLERFRYNKRVDFSLGYLLKQIHSKLLPFRDARGLHRPDFTWSLHSAPTVVEGLMHVITDKKKHSLVSRVVNEFKDTVIPNLDAMDRGVIHGDLNLSNVLVQPHAANPQQFDIVGIIDFADMYSSYFIYDLALTACYISLHDVDNHENKIALLLLGYDKSFTNLELRLLKICICARLCQSITLGLHTLTLNPNNEYVKNGAPLKYGWTLLDRLSQISHVEFTKLMRSKIEYFKQEMAVVKK